MSHPEAHISALAVYTCLEERIDGAADRRKLCCAVAVALSRSISPLYAINHPDVNAAVVCARSRKDERGYVGANWADVVSEFEAGVEGSGGFDAVGDTEAFLLEWHWARSARVYSVESGARFSGPSVRM